MFFGLSAGGRASLAAFILFIGGFAANAQTATRTSIAEQAAAVSEFEVNGLKVIVKRRPTAATVAGGLFIRGGTRNITAKNAGIEKLMLSVATDAGKNMPRQTVRRELSRVGATIGAESGPDYSVVAFASTRPAFNRVWEILSEVTLNPAFAPEDINRDREQMLVGLREAESAPEGALDALQDRMLYAGHPYSNEPSGTAATISALTPDDLRAYHKSVMRTSQLLLVFVGDLDANELKTKIAATFGRLPRGDYKDVPYPAIDFSKGTLEVTARNLPTTYVQGAFAAPSLADPDYPAMRVAITILYNLVYQEVRVRRQLSYAPGADLNTFAANTGNISVSSTDPNQAVSVMLEQVNFMRTRELSREPVEEIAGSFLTSYYLNQQTSSAQASDLARYELIGGGWRNSFEFLNRVREVKPADVQRVSEKYLKNIRFAVVGNQSAIKRSVFVPAE